MLIKRGISASPGVAIGPALVFGSEDFRIPNQFTKVDAVETEIIRFRCALENVCRELSEHQTLATERLGKQYGAIFEAHLQMARDTKLIEEIETKIRKRRYSPEFAASLVLRRHARKLKELGNAYLAERASDIFDLEKSLLRYLLGEQREELAQLTAPVVVLAHDLTPSETAGLNKQFVLAFATEAGGPTSHTAILAGAHEIPSVVGIGSFLADVSGGETVIIDGDHGEVIIDPDADCLARYQVNAARSKSVSEKLRLRGGEKSVTRDGTDIPVYGNIEFPDEIELCRERGADGIGLYRTEFLFLNRNTPPTEEEHFESYKQVLQAMGDRPVTIRTLDLGGDKVPGKKFEKEVNPALGLRAIRYCLSHRELFRQQLRALLRASVYGNLRVMFPLISSISELREARSELEACRSELSRQGVPVGKRFPIGIMVETPSAAWIADRLAQEADFFSIGTNDLIQYSLAIDRQNRDVAYLYRPLHLAILRSLDAIISAAKRAKIPVAMCGEMAGDATLTIVLLALGLEEFSMTAGQIPSVKEVIRKVSRAESVQLLNQAMAFSSAEEIERFIKTEVDKRFYTADEKP